MESFELKDGVVFTHPDHPNQFVVENVIEHLVSSSLSGGLIPYHLRIACKELTPEGIYDVDKPLVYFKVGGVSYYPNALEFKDLSYVKTLTKVYVECPK